MAHLILGLAYAQQGCLDEAAASIEKCMELSAENPLTLAIGAIGYVHAISGRRERAAGILQHLDGFYEGRYAADYCQAMVLAGLNESARALDRLEAAFKRRYDRLIYLDVDPAFDNLRQSARFKKLVANMGLPVHVDAGS